MKVAILHLSDLHINFGNADWIIDRAHQVANAVKMAFKDSDKIYVVVSGDIANEGLADQYEVAATFFTRLKSGLTNNYNGHISIEKRILCVPGNHDVYLKEENKMRSVLIKSVQDSYPDIDDSIFGAIVETQSAYADFVQKISEDETYKPSLLTTIDDKIGDFQVRFNLLNTAWMCGKKDQPGSIFMPMGGVKKTADKKEADLVISVMHHYYNWLAVDKQNKTKFERYVASSSNILIYGHEQRKNQAL